VAPLLAALGYKAVAATWATNTVTATNISTIAPLAGSADVSALPSALAAQYGFNPQPLVDFGYHLNDSLAFVPAYLKGYTHKNQLLDMALPGAAYFRCAPVTAAMHACTHDVECAIILL
jgi:hypothetical protein